jgi:putative addiction module killer protein
MYEIRKSETFDRWLDDLPDRVAMKRITIRMRHMETGNLGDWKSLGGGLFETRLHFGPGYRLYFGRLANSIILLAAGGDKSSQDGDIAIARAILRGERK